MSFEPATCPKHPSQKIVGVCGSCLAERLSLLTSVDVDSLGCPPSSPNLAADVSSSAQVEHNSGHVQQAIAYIPPRNEKTTTVLHAEDDERFCNRNEEELRPVLKVDQKNRCSDHNEEGIAPALPRDRRSDHKEDIAPVVLRDRCSSHKEVEITPVLQRGISRDRWRSKSLCEGRTGEWPGLEQAVPSASSTKATQLRSRTLRALFEIEDGKEPEKEEERAAGAATEEGAHRRRICGREGGCGACLYGCVTCAASCASSSSSRSAETGGEERPGLRALFWKKEREGKGRMKKKRTTKRKTEKKQQKAQEEEEENKDEKGKEKGKEKKQQQRKADVRKRDEAMEAKTEAMEEEEGEEEGEGGGVGVEEEDEERGEAKAGVPPPPRQSSWEAAELDSRSELRFNLTARALAAARATLSAPALTVPADADITAAGPDPTAADGVLAESCAPSPPWPYGRSFSSCAAFKTPPPPPPAYSPAAASRNPAVSAAVSKARPPPSRYYLRRISPFSFDQSGLLRFYLTPHRAAGRPLRSRVLPAGRRLPRSASKTLFVYQ